ncbi:hypothetical protein BZG36_05332 [Bifiguratus adelaidae]|uniref:Ketoreductase domain-containing protein n=1 Tax=Bifiguratus adelaidae TaxID=1938954 RepID=A0A261XTD0_9FUNG|nr:hypothetical protein BZG36_05332 [Bifiguratus adelaidae]
MRSVLITGGAGGIGLGIALHLHFKQLARVSILDKQHLADAQHLFCSKAGFDAERALFLSCDIADEAQVKAAVAKTNHTFGGIDCVINNAADQSTFGTSFEDLSLDRFMQTLTVNVGGTFAVTQAALPSLKRAAQGPYGASVINLSSTRAFQSERDTEAYSTSKGAITSLTHALAASLSPYHIRVNAIAPGWIDVRELQWRSGEVEPLSKEDHEQHWVGRVGTAQDVAHMACFLMDQEASGFMTGHTLPVDGGMTKKMMYVE